MAESEGALIKIGDKPMLVQVLATGEEYFGTLYSARKYIEQELGFGIATDLIAVGNIFSPGKNFVTAVGNVLFTSVDECPARVVEANRFE